MSTTSAISKSGKVPARETNPSAVVRCNTFHILARAFDPPRDMDDAHPEFLREIFCALDDSLHPPAHRAAEAWQVALQDRDALAVAYARLFLGPFEVLAPPYASLYLDPERRLMNETSMGVARWYAEAGLGPAPGPREAPDHITRELEFMYFLAFREITGDSAVWADRQRAFWQDHLSRWLPALAGSMAAAKCHLFYDALAELLTSFCKVETNRKE